MNEIAYCENVCTVNDLVSQTVTDGRRSFRSKSDVDLWAPSLAAPRGVSFGNISSSVIGFVLLFTFSNRFDVF
jgi:hypothetical protein